MKSGPGLHQKHALHKYANKDVSLRAWFIGIDVKHIDDRKLCCGNSSWCLDLKMKEFSLNEVLTASISQIMMKSNGKCVRITNETGEEVMSDTLYGDSIRLQQVLADFMLMSVNFTPSGGQLKIYCVPEEGSAQPFCSSCLSRDQVNTYRSWDTRVFTK